MVIAHRECCNHFAMLVRKHGVILCEYCGAHLACDGECNGCELKLKCLSVAELPFKSQQNKPKIIKVMYTYSMQELIDMEKSK